MNDDPDPSDCYEESLEDEGDDIICNHEMTSETERFLREVRALAPMDKTMLCIIVDKNGFSTTSKNIHRDVDVVDLLSGMMNMVTSKMVEDANDQEINFERN